MQATLWPVWHIDLIPSHHTSIRFVGVGTDGLNSLLKKKKIISFDECLNTRLYLFNLLNKKSKRYIGKNTKWKNCKTVVHTLFENESIYEVIAKQRACCTFFDNFFTLSLDRVNRFCCGGGSTLMEAYKNCGQAEEGMSVDCFIRQISKQPLFF